jgi:hypothetical protein
MMWVGLSSIAGLLAAAPSHAGNPNAIKPPDYASTPVARYASLESAACVQELTARQVPYVVAPALAGVDTPVRITGPIRGIKLTQIARSADEAINSDSSITDCRLALALDDFAQKLSSRKISEIGFLSAYRNEPSAHAKPGQRHPAGLAIDVAWMKREDGRELNVLRDFNGRIGARTCGKRAEPPRATTEGATQLRQIVCEAASERLFNLVLTPNYNREHHNHVHLEVRRNIDWILVQ